MRIKEAAILDTNTGIIFAGHRHHNIIWDMVKVHGYTPPVDRINHIQGFITEDGTFVDRVDALKIAMEANQIIHLHTGTQLFSEDLY